MKILITGAGGFVGSHLCEELIKNHEIIGISKPGFTTKKMKNLLKNPKFKLIECNIADYKSLSESLDKLKIDAVMHLAVNWCLRDSSEKDLDALKENAMSIFNLLFFCQKNKIKKFIYGSSMEVYGSAKYVPVDEKHPTNPENFYGLSKVLGEKCCESFYKNYGINIIILRCSGIYGPRREGGAVNNFVKKALENQDITVDNDGSFIWDACYVKDIVSAYIKSLEKVEDVKFDIINVGCGKGLVLKEVVEKIVKLSKSKSKINFSNVSKNFKFYYDIGKAKKILNFNPKSFEDNITDFIKISRGIK